MSGPTLEAAARALLAEARRATLTTIDARDGRPRSVPVCYALVGDAIWSALDEKPKRGDDPTTLRRVRNLQADDRASLLVDRWSEDWTRLAFLELDVRGALVDPGTPDHAAAVEALRTRYPQYRDHRLEERPMLRLRVVGLVSWSATPEPPGA